MCAYYGTPTVGFLSIGSSAYHQCAGLVHGTDANTISCWGYNLYGSLGSGSTQMVAWNMVRDRPPLQLPDGLIPTAVATGYAHTCVLFSNGKVCCFGIYSAIGTGNTVSLGLSLNDMGNNLPFVSFPAGSSIRAVAAGYLHTCVLMFSWAITCWGSNVGGELGIGSMNPVGSSSGDMGDALQLVQLPTNQTASAVSCGLYFTCVLSSSSSVYCWGSSNSGRLGIGSTSDIGDGPGEMGNNLKAVSLPSGFTGVKSISCGSAHTCVLNSDGRRAWWGFNGEGQLGIGSKVASVQGLPLDNITSALLPLGLKAIAVSCGMSHTCALFHNGSIGCWGSNQYI